MSAGQILFNTVTAVCGGELRTAEWESLSDDAKARWETAAEIFKEKCL